MRLRIVSIAAVAAVAAAGGAAAQQQPGGPDREVLLEPPQTGPVEVELDGDPAPERVAARKLGEFRFAARVEDDCFGAKRLAPVHDRVAIETVTLPSRPPLLYTEASSGASGRFADFRLHRLGPATDARGCPQLTALFTFPDAKAMPRPPKGTAAGSFGVRFADDGTIGTTEGLYRAQDGSCCPRYVRRSTWRYDQERDRYVRTRSRTTRFRSPTPAR